MKPDRLRANLFYLTVFCLISYFIYSKKSNKVYFTGEYKGAVVKSIAPNYSKYSLKVTATIITVDNEKIIRVLSPNRGLRAGQNIQLRIYRSKDQRIIKYKI